MGQVLALHTILRHMLREVKGQVLASDLLRFRQKDRPLCRDGMLRKLPGCKDVPAG